MIKVRLHIESHSACSPAAGILRALVSCQFVSLAVLFAITAGMLAQSPAAQKYASLNHDVQQALAQGNYARAIEVYREILRLQGNSAPLLLQLGVAQYQNGDYTAAVQSLQSSLQMQPHIAVAEAFLGLSEAASGDSDTSITLLAKSFASRDETIDKELKRIVGARLGQIYANAGRLCDAETIYMTLLKDFPNDPQVLYQSFWLYMSLGRQVMNTLVREAPDSYRTHKLVGLILLEKGNYAAAAKQFRQALNDNPDGPALHYELGILALRSGDESGANREFEAELHLHPYDARSYYQLAEGAARTGRLDQAGELYSKALQFDPTFSDALVGLCRVSLTQNQPGKALKDCREATRMAPDNRSAHYLLARVYRTLGQAAIADEELAIFEKLQKQTTTQVDFLNEAQLGTGTEQ